MVCIPSSVWAESPVIHLHVLVEMGAEEKLVQLDHQFVEYIVLHIQGSDDLRLPLLIGEVYINRALFHQ